MITYYSSKNNELNETKIYTPGCWTKVFDPTKEDIAKIIKQFNLSAPMIADGLDIYELPRVEEEEKKVYIYLRIPTKKVDNPTGSFLLILHEKGIITISTKDLEIFEELIKKPAPKNNAQWATTFFSLTSRMFNLDVRKILKEISSEKKQMNNLNNNDLIELIKKEDTLNDYLSSFPLLIETDKKLVKTKLLKLNEKDREEIEDLEIDLEQTLSNCRFVLKNISNMRDYYSTTLSGNLNKILTVLTVFTVLLTIPTTISGIYGMNIALPGQSFQNIFWFLAILVMIIWAILLIILRWKKVLN